MEAIQKMKRRLHIKLITTDIQLLLLKEGHSLSDKPLLVAKEDNIMGTLATHLISSLNNQQWEDNHMAMPSLSMEIIIPEWILLASNSTWNKTWILNFNNSIPNSSKEEFNLI